VVVAAGAVDRHAEEAWPDGGDEVVEHVVAVLLAVGRVVVPDAEAVEAGRDDRVGVRRGVRASRRRRAARVRKRSYGLSSLNERMT
jgi:hypothetical protein